MILGVGVDILAISRIGAIVRRGGKYTERFARRILCQKENAHYSAQIANCGAAEQTRYLATRWCVKEAVYKAAYPYQKLRWSDVHVFKEGPKLAARIAWAPELAHARAHVSISHDHGLLISYAIVEV
ncbi:hypothetical protein H4R23_005964 [Coemansia sp. Cherry 401B]|nr:hypothetical protein IWW54_003421 [Coemansia sp. RSA 2705]KAJ2365551.1 hypothetical protein H4S01_003181 [Coemansia sp. RSA 2610]KAJ2713451.1 hypothetical protein H4R23_005964 [Coemansia sp. Cherry 401B]